MNKLRGRKNPVMILGCRHLKFFVFLHLLIWVLRFLRILRKFLYFSLQTSRRGRYGRKTEGPVRWDRPDNRIYLKATKIVRADLIRIIVKAVWERSHTAFLLFFLLQYNCRRFYP